MRLAFRIGKDMLLAQDKQMKTFNFLQHVFFSVKLFIFASNLKYSSQWEYNKESILIPTL